MSILHGMLRAAAAGRAAVAGSAALVERFVLDRMCGDGGFSGRGGHSDLYYTVFALAALKSLGAELPVHQARRYLASFGDGQELDLVHKCSLARCWAIIDQAMPAEHRHKLLADIEQFRSGDGGYDQMPCSPSLSAYGTFLAVGAYQDCGEWLPHPSRALASLQSLRTPGGGFANDAVTAIAMSPATAAAAAAIGAISSRQGAAHLDPAAQAWLGHCEATEGGYSLMPGGSPDLLATAVALHALRLLGTPAEAMRESHRRFVLSLQLPHGGFRGGPQDPTADVEYTFYALLALGSLEQSGGQRVP